MIYIQVIQLANLFFWIIFNHFESFLIFLTIEFKIVLLALPSGLRWCEFHEGKGREKVKKFGGDLTNHIR